MAIDIQVHIGKVGTRVATQQQLTTHVADCRLDFALVSNLDAAAWPSPAVDAHETDANLICLRACTIPQLVPLYWVRPGRVDSHLAAFAGALATEAFGGALFAPTHNDFAADSPALDPYLAVLAKLNLPAVFLTGRDERAAPFRVYNLARRHPAVAFVLCNAANDAHVREAIDVIQRASERGDARLFLDTSAPSIDELAAIVRAVGAERVMFGSDAPGEGPSGRSAAALLEAMRSRLTEEEFFHVTHQNAAEVFRIKALEGARAPLAS